MASAQLMVHRQADELPARRTLRAQITRLEHELSQIVAGGFPHIEPCVAARPVASSVLPHLLTLGELERQRDQLAEQVGAACRQAAARAQLQQRAWELLQDMKREPRRHKFVRLRVVDLGERGCGVWEVRPRLGLIGMLAGWWQVKLSSGCP